MYVCIYIYYNISLCTICTNMYIYISWTYVSNARYCTPRVMVLMASPSSSEGKSSFKAWRAAKLAKDWKWTWMGGYIHIYIYV